MIKGIDTSNAGYFAVEDMTFHGGLITNNLINDPSTERPVNWFYFQRAVIVRFDQVEITRTFGHAIYAEQLWDTVLHSVDITRC